MLEKNIWRYIVSTSVKANSKCYDDAKASADEINAMRGDNNIFDNGNMMESYAAYVATKVAISKLQNRHTIDTSQKKYLIINKVKLCGKVSDGTACHQTFGSTCPDCVGIRGDQFNEGD